LSQPPWQTGQNSRMASLRVGRATGVFTVVRRRKRVSVSRASVHEVLKAARVAVHASPRSWVPARPGSGRLTRGPELGELPVREAAQSGFRCDPTGGSAPPSASRQLRRITSIGHLEAWQIRPWRECSVSSCRRHRKPSFLWSGLRAPANAEKHRRPLRRSAGRVFHDVGSCSRLWPASRGTRCDGSGAACAAGAGPLRWVSTRIFSGLSGTQDAVAGCRSASAAALT